MTEQVDIKIIPFDKLFSDYLILIHDSNKCKLETYDKRIITYYIIKSNSASISFEAFFNQIVVCLLCNKFLLYRSYIFTFNKFFKTLNIFLL